MEYFIGFIAGILFGGLFGYLLFRSQKKSAQQSAKDVENAFSTLSLKALKENSEEFLKLANESLAKQTQSGTADLESKKKLIDQNLDLIKENLAKVEKTITEFDSKREKSFGEVSQQLKHTAQQTEKLQETTSKLQASLSSTSVRGQWGERMTEDILRVIGFVEGVNYLKNRAQDTVATRPDYTFFLPGELKVNMDVKFPLDNYRKYSDEQDEQLRSELKRQFLRDTRQRIKEVTNRDYINPAENTVDYVLVFIPSEQIYCFIHENDGEVIDYALAQKVILCSPLTLYAMLAVIRQAVDNFNFERTTSQVYNLLREFRKQWDAFKDVMDKMGKKIEDAREEYRKLVTTRSDKLEKPLYRIEEIRERSGIVDTPLIQEHDESDADDENSELS